MKKTINVKGEYKPNEQISMPPYTAQDGMVKVSYDNPFTFVRVGNFEQPLAGDGDFTREKFLNVLKKVSRPTKLKPGSRH